MPATSLPRIPLEADMQQVIIALNQALEELDWLFGGALDSKNAREFGGWQVSQTKLETKQGVYPRIEFDSGNLAIAAFQSADKYLRVSPDAFGSTPGIVISNSTAAALIYLLGSSLEILTTAGSAEIQLSSGKNLDLFCNTNSGYHTRVDSWDALLNVNSGRTLQQEVGQINENMIDINSLFAYCNSLDARITALGG